MKSTGVVRQLDNLGRVVLPIELRRTMDISVKDPLEVFVDGDDPLRKVVVALRLHLLLRHQGTRRLSRQVAVPPVH